MLLAFSFWKIIIIILIIKKKKKEHLFHLNLPKPTIQFVNTLKLRNTSWVAEPEAIPTFGKAVERLDRIKITGTPEDWMSGTSVNTLHI